MHALARRDHWLWRVASVVLLLGAIIGVVAEAGPTAFVATILVGVTLYARTSDGDAPRLLVASASFVVLGLAASFIPTAAGCGLPLIESAQHATEPTPHIHGPCEQANDRRALAGAVLLIGSVATLYMAQRRRS